MSELQDMYYNGKCNMFIAVCLYAVSTAIEWDDCEQWIDKNMEYGSCG
jgi:hypothetical protein